MRLASFVYYGSTPNKHRTVTLRQSGDKYVIEIEGMPALTQTYADEEKAKCALLGWHGMSMKDWGSSEIDWGDFEPVENLFEGE